MTLPLRLYRLASRYIAGAALPKLERKMEEAGLHARLRERRGQSSIARPEGRIFWLHGASVGEGLSLLTLAERLLALDPAAHFLLTTGTIGAAKVLGARCNGRIIHQFAPLDSPEFVKAFLDHWSPALLVVAESELWPNTLLEAKARAIPMALVNARLSANSRRQWNRMGKTIATLLRSFKLVHVQDAQTAAAMEPMVAGELLKGSNLKAAAAPLPYDPAVLETVRTRLKGRPRWLAASTHKGEEYLVLEAHKALLQTRPDLLLILVPRHPDRADEIETLTKELGLTLTRRSRDERATAQVYLADTFGEMGIWLRNAPLVLLGGSLVEGIGGHNPWEPAAVGAAVLSGPYVANAKADFETLCALGAAKMIEPAALAVEVEALLASSETAAAMGHAGLMATQGADREISDVARKIILLPQSEPR